MYVYMYVLGTNRYLKRRKIFYGGIQPLYSASCANLTRPSALSCLTRKAASLFLTEIGEIYIMI